MGTRRQAPLRGAPDSCHAQSRGSTGRRDDAGPCRIVSWSSEPSPSTCARRRRRSKSETACARSILPRRSAGPRGDRKGAPRADGAKPATGCGARRMRRRGARSGGDQRQRTFERPDALRDDGRLDDRHRRHSRSDRRGKPSAGWPVAPLAEARGWPPSAKCVPDQTNANTVKVIAGP
jgi:hypothetical protein